MWGGERGTSPACSGTDAYCGAGRALSAHSSSFANDDDDEALISNSTLLKEIRRAFTTEEEDFDARAVSEGWIIALPQKASLVLLEENGETNEGGGVFDESMLRDHVLRRVDVCTYTTLSKKRVELQNGDDAALIVGGENDGGYDATFEEPRTVKILFEEVVYAESGGTYKILCIKRPLSGPGNVPCFPDGKEIYDDDRTVDVWLAIMRGSPAMHRLDNFAEEFNKHYVLVQSPIGIRHATKKIIAAVDEGLDILLVQDSRFVHAVNNSRFCSLLALQLESYAMMGVHAKIFFSLCEFYSPREREVQKRLHELRHQIVVKGDCTALKDLGGDVRLLVGKKLTLTIIELQYINDHRCPLQKLRCLMRVIENISKDLEASTDRPHADSAEGDFDAHERAAYSFDHPFNFLPEFGGDGNDPDSFERIKLDADNLLGVIVYVLLEAAPAQLVANMQYIQDFALTCTAKGRLMYTLAKFQAAVSFIESYQDSTLETQISPFGSHRQAPKIIDHPDVPRLSGMTKSPSSAIEKTQLMSETSDDRKQRASATLAKLLESEGSPDEKLGDFLTALRGYDVVASTRR